MIKFRKRKRWTTTAGTLSKAQTPASKRRNTMHHSVTKDPERKAAKAITSMPVATKTSIATLAKLSPVGRLCWQPTMPFPPMLETTLEEVEQFAYHPRPQNFTPVITWPYFSTTTPNGKAYVGQVFANKIDFGGTQQNIFPTVHNTSQPYNTDAILGVSDQSRPDRGTPYAREFFRHYKYAVITGCRMAISVQALDQHDEATEYVLVVKKHTLSEEHHQHGSNPNSWNGTAISRQNYGFIQWNDYKSQNKGTFLDRAPIFEDGLIAATVEVPAAGCRGDPKTIIHDSWSLKGDEGVSVADLLTSVIMKNDDAEVGPQLDIEDSTFSTDVWANGQDVATVSTFTQPKAQPSWYWWIQPVAKETSWLAVAKAVSVDGAPVTTGGAIALGSPCFNVKVKRQFDVTYFGHRLSDDLGEQIDTIGEVN